MPQRSEYIFLSIPTVQPYTYTIPIPSTNGSYYPPFAIGTLEPIFARKFSYYTTDVTIDGLTYQSSYIEYTGKTEILASLEIDLSALSNTTTSVQFVAYRGSNGKFPTVQVPTFSATTDLPIGSIINTSGNGLVKLRPGDTLAIYFKNTEAVPANGIQIIDFMFTIQSVENIC